MNGQELTDVQSNLYTAEFWEYDAWSGVRWNQDPISFAEVSPYTCFLDNPIYFSDASGAEPEGDDKKKPIEDGKGRSGTFKQPAKKTPKSKETPVPMEKIPANLPMPPLFEGTIKLPAPQDQGTISPSNPSPINAIYRNIEKNLFNPFIPYLDVNIKAGFGALQAWYKINDHAHIAVTSMFMDNPRGLAGYGVNENELRDAKFNTFVTFGSGMIGPWMGEVSVAPELVEGLVPNGKYYSVAFETNLPKNLYPGGSYWSHFKASNEALEASMSADEVFNAGINSLGIKIPRSNTGSILGKSPTNWVWHHDLNSGVMQLVPKSQHPSIPGGIFWETMHPNGIGGNSIWNK